MKVKKASHSVNTDFFVGSISLAFFLVLTITIFFNKTYLDIFDRYLFESVNTSTLNIFPGLLLIMQLGSGWAICIYTLITWLLRFHSLAKKIVITGILVSGISTLLKFIIERGRPYDIMGYEVIRRAGEWGYGYPSGHTATAAAMATILSPYLSKRLQGILWVVVLLVGMGRVYAGVHSPLDVVGGLLLGISIGSFMNFYFLKFFPLQNQR